MDTEKRYKIVRLQDDIAEEKRLKPFLGATSVAYAGIAALLLYTGVNNIVAENYALGAISTIMGASFAFSDVVSISLLKDVIKDHINDKQELEKMSR